ncbi:hypothetical protein [Dasania marina]|uniref:hypothetical protein n=1 Tax=Dasania marina TaxID=471499 RepID=UPI0030D91DCC|tara:strand:- start:33728 stop:34393 length:666 start_codon:yes stop_codon:yes gene_type:complete
MFLHLRRSLLCLSSFFSAVAAADVPIQLIDTNGAPVANAVVLAAAAQAKELAVVNSVLIDQINMQFSPHVVVAPPNTPVYFPNSDKTRHQVYSFSAPNNFELKLYRQKDAPPVQFSSLGVVELGCNIHDSMKGYIYVSDVAVYGVSDGQGRLNLATNVTAKETITLDIWHPTMGVQKPYSVNYQQTQPSQAIRIPIQIINTETPVSSTLKDRLQRFKVGND